MATYPLHFSFKLHVFNSSAHFGTGVVTLMQLIQKGHSLRSACKEMNLSYSKAWSLIQQAEEDLGVELIVKRKGGVSRIGSTLTPEGEQLLIRYLAFKQDCLESVEQLFSKHFEA